MCSVAGVKLAFSEGTVSPPAPITGTNAFPGVAAHFTVQHPMECFLASPVHRPRVGLRGFILLVEVLTPARRADGDIIWLDRGTAHPTRRGLERGFSQGFEWL